MKNSQFYKNSIFAAVCFFAVVASAQNTDENVQKLYARAKEMRKNLPERGLEGLYTFLQFGFVNPSGLQTWKSVPNPDSASGPDWYQIVPAKKLRPQLRLGFVYHPIEYISVGISASYAAFSFKEDANLIDKSGHNAVLDEPFLVHQFGLHPSVLIHTGCFYLGTGYDIFRHRTHGTKAWNWFKQADGSSIGYATQVKQPVPTAVPQFIAGFETRNWLPAGKLGIEICLGGDRLYALFRVTGALSKRTVIARRKYIEAFRGYEKIFNEAEAIDRGLHPEKFVVPE